ncbi:hypothetical protein [Kibdelosporangium persicum]|uniref:hypothetical protein n=1 Tax=Kibdelosporangium persicum TaxID=2698649 RepID=UPI0039EDF786
MGRSSLLNLINEMVPVADGQTTPVLVIEGCGGSGRTRLLTKIAEEWQGKTPTVLVRPLELDGDDDSAVRPVLAAAMLGLSVGAPGYNISFPRVILAHIAMQENDADINPDVALVRLRERINTYTDRTALTAFLTRLVEAVGALAGNIKFPGAAEIAPDTARGIAEAIVMRLQRSTWLVKRTWSSQVWSWFGHQGQGLSTEPENALLRLARQYRSEDADIRRDVDDLLVAALLADLRYGLANAANRPANVVVLLDDADTAAARSFVRSLIRVRRAIADIPRNPESALPDPLTIVTTSGGLLAGELAAEQPAAQHWDETELPGTVRLSGSWLRVSTADLSRDNVFQLTKGFDWPDHIGTGRIASPVYRLTRGHPQSTEFVLKRLQAQPSWLNTVDLDQLLHGVEDTLLLPFVRALDEKRVVNPALLTALITLSAARNRQEAGALTTLLPAPVGRDSQLFTSPTLWIGRDGRLRPLVRYLGMRALSRRPADDDASWTVVFETLRANTDTAGRLHHDRMLGHRDQVAAELAELRGGMRCADWLALLDEVTATVDPRERDIDVIRGVDQPSTSVGHIARLLGVIPALDHDPCLTVPADIKILRAHARHSFTRIADDGDDPLPCLLRADRYQD